MSISGSQILRATHRSGMHAGGCSAAKTTRILRLGAVCIFFLLAVCSPFKVQAYTGMVSFGDSLSDVGNTVNLLTETESRVLTGYDPNFYFTNR